MLRHPPPSHLAVSRRSVCRPLGADGSLPWLLLGDLCHFGLRGAFVVSWDRAALPLAELYFMLTLAAVMGSEVM